MVTDRIVSLTRSGLLLESGRRLEADVVVTATGLNLQVFGGISLSVDGCPVQVSDTLVYRGTMLSGVPNFSLSIGYTNASWTLKVGLLCDYLCRLLGHLDEHGYDTVRPVAPEGLETRPLLDFAAGYVQRSIEELPRQGSEAPWVMSMSFYADRRLLREEIGKDGCLRFTGPSDRARLRAAGRPAGRPAAVPPAWSSGIAWVSSSSVIRGAGPETERPIRGAPWGTATATQRTPTSCSPSSTAWPTWPTCTSWASRSSTSVTVCGGVPGESGAPEQSPDLVLARGGQQGLADGRAVRQDPAADLGEHPHRVPPGHLRDVDHTGRRRGPPGWRSRRARRRVRRGSARPRPRPSRRPRRSAAAG